MKKKILLGVASVAGSLATFADDPVSAESLLTQASTALTDLLATAIPIVGGVIVACLGLWGVIKLIILIRRVFGFGTGR